MIERSFRQETSEERFKKKTWLIRVKTAVTHEDPGLEYKVEEVLSERVVKWLTSVGYSSEELEKLKIVIPGIHFEEVRNLLRCPEAFKEFLEDCYDL